MDLQSCLTRLEATLNTVESLCRGVDETQARWRPTPDVWSLLEVINHLADEEVDDFRRRLNWVLEPTGEPPPAIDPEGWVTARDYNQRDLQESLERWQHERRASLEWLRSLDQPNWDQDIPRPDITLRAGDLLHAWFAHDLLHLRQLIELHYAYHAQAAKPYEVVYGGDWT
jgi:hypothetical protein